MNKRFLHHTLSGVGVLLASLLLMPTDISAQESTVLLRGHVASSRKANPSDSGPAHLGVYTFRADGTDFKLLSGETPLSGAFGGLWYNGCYYQSNAAVRDASKPGVSYRGIARYDASSWTLQEITPVERWQLSMDLTDDNGKVYGCFYDPSAQGLCWGSIIMDPVHKYPYTYIAGMPIPMNCVAADREGVIYGIGDDGVLYRINKHTGATTVIGATGVIPGALASAAIDQRTGKMYWTVIDNRQQSYIYEINTTTARATKLAQLPYGDQIVGLEVVYEPDGKAPSTPLNLALDFTDGSLNGKAMFRIPGTTVDGTAGSGEVEYTLFANGIKKAAGTAPYGSQITEPLNLDSDAFYEVRVRLNNSYGDSHKAAASRFIGNDKPLVPASVSAKYASGKFTVSWKAVTAGVMGGYIDKNNVTYRVVRMPDNIIVADSVKSVSITDEVSIPGNYTVYQYKVQALCNGKKSDTGMSNKVGLGVIQPPYLETFDDATSLMNYTVIDGNNDKKVWQHFASGQYVRSWYTANKAQDDWLITPTVRLEAGKAYLVSFDAAVFNDSYGEHLELKLGTAPNAAAMTTTLIPDTEVKTKSGVTFEKYVTVEATGNYYIGLHAISATPKTYLQIDNMQISAPLSASAPGLCGKFTVLPDADGNRQATLSGTAPTTTLGGETLTSIDKMEIFRDTTLITTLTEIAPGASFSYTDKTAPASAAYTYSAIASNSHGKGGTTRTQVFVGVKTAKPVTNVKIEESSMGVARISWTAPTQDVDGNPLSADKISYMIVQANKSTLPVIADSLHTTSYDWTVTTEGQTMANVAVYAVTDGGISTGVVSAMIPVGKPYAIPYEESFAWKKATSTLGTRGYKNNPTWTFCSDGDLVGITSSDNDNGYIYSKGNMGLDASMLFTGKIDLTQAKDPYFSFYVYNLRNATSKPDNTNDIEIMVKVVGEDDDFRQLVAPRSTHVICGSVAEERWFPVRTDLSEFKGKVIQLGIKALVKRYQYNIFDKLHVGEKHARNLSADRPLAPSRIRVNTDYTVRVPVRNLGSERADSYSVELYRTDRETPLETKNGVAVTTDSVVYVDFACKLSLMDSTSVGYYAKIIYDGDMDVSDNVSGITEVHKRPSNKLAPRDLTVSPGSQSGKKVNLSWNTPPLGALGIEHDVTEDFDGYDSFSHTDIGDWTMVDGDRKPVGSVSGVYVPGIIPDQTLASFFVFDRNGGAFNKSFDAMSGSKFLASFFRQDDGLVDDWAISPLLSGNAQTITFYAKSYNNKYPETFEVLYSTQGTDTTTFRLLERKERISNTWTKYSFDLPAGALHFAIRSVSQGAFLLMIDDVKFIAAPEQVTGYHIYRDGVRLTTVPVAHTTYQDVTMPAGSSATYMVTAVYRGGNESDASNRASYTSSVSGIDMDSSVVIRGLKGMIEIEGAQGKVITVCEVNGNMLFNGKAGYRQHISATPGLYLVRVGTVTAKVLVK